MHKKSTRVFLAAAMVLALGSAAWAQSQTHVTYQGRLTDAGGPANGTFDFDFKIFDVPAGGVPVWSETIPGVTVTQGLFTVILGQTVPLDSTIFSGSPRWLEIVVQGTTLSPRQELSASPGAVFASLALDFRGILGGEVTGTQTATVVTNAVPTNTANAIVRRDGAGNFAAGTITAGLNGNATTATTATNFSGPLAGEVTGTQSATVVSNAVPANIANAIVRRDGSGSFAAGTIALLGNLDLQSTASASVGVVTKAGIRFLHNFGNANTFVGESTGNMSLTGNANTGVGALALTSDTTGVGNTAAGASALVSNTTGLSNSAFGSSALALNTTGGNNTAVGVSALFSNTAASNNSACGFQALYQNTGADNSAFGYRALFNNTTANFNAAFGSGALLSNTTGDGNSAFGASALQSNTNSANSAFGYQALLNNTTAFSNSAFGFQALLGNTTGCCNTAFGDRTLRVDPLGTFNAAFGYQALVNLMSGISNTAIGAGAGFALTSGSDNIYVGADSGSSSESNTIRIGGIGGQTSTFIAGIFGQVSASGAGVFVNSSGKLGTLVSSRRYKDGIADLAGESDVLMRLRPVAFYYRPEYDETHTRQYGLVAEEVAEVAPALVAFDEQGAPQAVRYHFVNAMLLNEVQKQRRRLQEQASRIEELEARLARLEARASEGR
jgi:Chaperone of endosialidase